MNRNYTVLDGAMGTQLAMRLGPGADAQEAALCNPDVIVQIHREYIEAGAQIVYTATCDTNRFNTGRYPIEETMPAAVRLAKEAGRDKGIPVALDIGSTGKLIGPYGDISRNRAYEAFAELVRAGRGADIIAVETIFDLKELRVAVLAAMEHSDLPVYGTMTFTDAGRSITGCTLQCFALTAQSLGVQALGLNCSVGPAGMNNMIGVLAGWTDLPIICKPNAGMPDPETKKFNVGAKEFADLCARAAESGATLLGVLRHGSRLHRRAVGAFKEHPVRAAPRCGYIPPHMLGFPGSGRRSGGVHTRVLVRGRSGGPSQARLRRPRRDGRVAGGRRPYIRHRSARQPGRGGNAYRGDSVHREHARHIRVRGREHALVGPESIHGQGRGDDPRGERVRRRTKIRSGHNLTAC